jgi:periplasmic divalent cation tolerance protein
VEREDEWILTCITTRASFERLAALVVDLHPFDVPEIIATPVVLGSPEYLAWVQRETGST